MALTVFASKTRFKKNNMVLRILVVTIFSFLLLGTVNAQSKKEQIIILSNKIDSLNAVIENERLVSQSKEGTLNFTIDSIAKKLGATKNELTIISRDFDEKKEENSSLNALKNRLEIELISMKEDNSSLNALKNQIEIELISLKEVNARLRIDSIRDSRFEKFDEERIINVNNKPLVLYPFEMFDVMTFEGLSNTGLTESLDFIVQESGERISFYGDNNKLEFDESKWQYDMDFILDKAIVLLKFDEGTLRRPLIKNRNYKVIYCYHSDSELWRYPFPTESNDGYYIVDVLELNQPFEREKEN